MLKALGWFLRPGLKAMGEGVAVDKCRLNTPVGAPGSVITVVTPWGPDQGRSLSTVLYALGQGVALGGPSIEAGKGGLPALPRVSPHSAWR